AEDGIRDFHVTGVQTCALPISVGPRLCQQFFQAPDKSSRNPCQDCFLPRRTEIGVSRENIERASSRHFTTMPQFAPRPPKVPVRLVTNYALTLIVTAASFLLILEWG